MRLTTVLLLATFLHVSASGLAQHITFKRKNASFEQLIREIRMQTGYDVLVSANKVRDIGPRDVDFKNAPLQEVLKVVLRDQPLTFEVEDRTVLIREKEASFLDKLAVSVNLVQGLFRVVDVSGVVVDEKGLPLAGANVRVKGGKGNGKDDAKSGDKVAGKSTFTNKDGKFFLQGVDDQAVLLISYVGYVEQEVRVQRELTVTLEQKSAELQEVVVAYGKMTQQALTGAVTVISGEQIASQPNRSFDKSLQGLVPGLLVTNGTGQPGGGVANMVLRGISSGSDGSAGSTARNPLIVLDGIPVTQDHMQYNVPGGTTPVTNPVAQLNPNDIESISILKDAAAIALYGSKASNGVILVTTKRGNQGKSSIQFSHQFDLGFRPDENLKMLDQSRYLELVYESYRNVPRLVSGVSVPWTDADILADLNSKFPVQGSGADAKFYPAPNWYDLLYRPVSPTFTNNLGLRGGNEKSAYYLNAEYTSQKGIVKKTDFSRASVRLNSDFKPLSFLKLSNSSFFSYVTRNQNNPTAGVFGYAGAQLFSPLNPVKTADGKYYLNFRYGTTSDGVNFGVTNPVAAQEYNKDNGVDYRGSTSFKADVAFLKYFNFSSTFGADFMVSENYVKIDPRLLSESQVPIGIAEHIPRRANLISTNLLTFDKTFNIHRVNVLVGYEAQIQSSKTSRFESRGTAASLYYYDEIGSPGFTTTGSLQKSRGTLLSQFAQANYSILDRYFLSGSYRRDGSSAFGNQQQWADFWSTGAGWLVSRESFMNSLATWLPYLKIRGSLGVAGNSANVGPTIRYDVLEEEMLNNQPLVYPSRVPANTNIKWESTFNWDFGLEGRLWNDRISFQADVYRKFTRNLIYLTTLAPHTGFEQVRNNIGNLNNEGVEITINTSILKTHTLNWMLNTSWSANSNVLKNAFLPFEDLNSLYGYIANEEGRNYNSFYMPVWLGVNPENGNPLWKGPGGVPTSISTSAQKEFVGKPQPDGFGMLGSTVSWKGLQLNVQMYYQYGFQIYDDALSILTGDGARPYLSIPELALNRWQKPGDIAQNPARRLGDNRSSVWSTRYLFDGDYLKLQQVSLSYQIPKDILNRYKLQSMQFFLQGHNLHQWSLIQSGNPDNANVVGTLAFSYPQARTYSFGAIINF